MRILEQPFLTRREILSVFRPGQVTTERPFRTLRERHAASAGFKIPIRGVGGQVLGGLQLYSALNADAARAFRLTRVEQATELAAAAQQLERSEPADYLKALIEMAASRAGRGSLDRVPALQRYLDRRRRHNGDALDSDAAIREWMSHAEAWLPEAADIGDAHAALIELGAQARRVRTKLSEPETASLTTFFGLVRRMDATAAELENDSGDVILVAREELEREGLAVLGQAVTLLWEGLPGGGTYLLPRPAVSVDDGAVAHARSPFDDRRPLEGAVPLEELAAPDAAWLERELARNPQAVPVGALEVRES